MLVQEYLSFDCICHWFILASSHHHFLWIKNHVKLYIYKEKMFIFAWFRIKFFFIFNFNVQNLISKIKKNEKNKYKLCILPVKQCWQLVDTKYPITYFVEITSLTQKFTGETDKYEYDIFSFIFFGLCAAFRLWILLLCSWLFIPKYCWWRIMLHSTSFLLLICNVFWAWKKS